MEACGCCLWQLSNLGDCILPSFRFSCGAKTTYSSCIFPNKTKRTTSGVSVCRGRVWERGTKQKKSLRKPGHGCLLHPFCGVGTLVSPGLKFCLYVGSFILYSKLLQAYTECCRWRCFTKSHNIHGRLSVSHVESLTGWGQGSQGFLSEGILFQKQGSVCHDSLRKGVIICGG